MLLASKPLLLSVLVATTAAQDMIGSFTTTSDVSDHALIDLDQKEIEALLNSNITTRYDDVFTIYSEGKNSNRTIQGFSTMADTRFRVDGVGEYYKDFQLMLDYYGSFDFADKWTTAAIMGTNAGLAMGNVDFSASTDLGRIDATEKGTVYLNIFPYVIRELEDAIDDCKRGDKADSLHALDEAVAFYTGSLFTDATDFGLLLYGLAQKRCANYNTCADGFTGEAKVNTAIFAGFEQMQDDIEGDDCDAAATTLAMFTKDMYIPFVQGALRYGFLQSKGDASEKVEAEGIAFAAAVLPLIHSCSADDAATIYELLNVGNEDVFDFDMLRTAFENNYECMGIECSDIGGLVFQETDVDPYFPDFLPCGVAAPTDPGAPAAPPVEAPVAAPPVEAPVAAPVNTSGTGSISLFFGMVVSLGVFAVAL